MNFYRNGVSTTVIALVVVLVVVIVAAGAYIAFSPAPAPATTTVTATTTAVSTATTTAVSTATATTTAVSTATTTAVSTATTTVVSTTSLSSTLGPAVSLTGAGGTLINPVMTLWTYAYNQAYPNIQVNYASVGSGAGIAQITAQTVNFGESDAPLTAAQYSALKATLVTIPISASAVVPAYNLPGVTASVKFTGAVLANIFLGKITQWNDPALAALNPGVTLPAHAITVIHRSDGSGTMFAFTNYLSDASKQWKTQVGSATSVNWPVGLGCKGNEGVAGCIANTQYSIGPLEIAYEITNKGAISYGSVQNAAGNFILANLTNAQAAVAAGGTSGLPAGSASWTGVSIINNIYNDTAATNAYPITTFTYALVYQQQTNQLQGAAVVYFLWWIVNHAQSAGGSIGYVALPPNVVALDDATLSSVTYNGTPIYTGP